MVVSMAYRLNWQPVFLDVVARRLAGESTGSMLCLDVPPLSQVRRTFFSPTLFFFFDLPMTQAYPRARPHALTDCNRASKVGNDASGGGSIPRFASGVNGNAPNPALV